MSKLYGYKEQDVKGLIEFLKENSNKSLTEIFRLYSAKTGKAKGTIRNMYYALAGRSNKDQTFCNATLNGKPLAVNKIVQFNEQEEAELIKNVLIGKSQNRSVRSVILQLANGNAVLALRYQNKYRNIAKNPQKLIEVEKQLRAQGLIPNVSVKPENSAGVMEVQYRRLKKEIDELVDKISIKVRKENAFLKSKIAYLEAENLRLNNVLYENNALELLKSISRNSGGAVN